MISRYEVLFFSYRLYYFFFRYYLPRKKNVFFLLLYRVLIFDAIKYLRIYISIESCKEQQMFYIQFFVVIGSDQSHVQVQQDDHIDHFAGF